MIHKKRCRFSMRFRRSKASEDDRGAVRTASSATVHMTRRPYVKACELAISSHLLATRRTTHGSGLGQWRWVVERTFAWLNQFRRLRVRYEKRADIHQAFLSLGCALICWHVLRKSWANSWR